MLRYRRSTPGGHEYYDFTSQLPVAKLPVSKLPAKLPLTLLLFACCICVIFFVSQLSVSGPGQSMCSTTDTFISSHRYPCVRCWQLCPSGTEIRVLYARESIDGQEHLCKDETRREWIVRGVVKIKYYNRSSMTHHYRTLTEPIEMCAWTCMAQNCISYKS